MTKQIYAEEHGHTPATTFAAPPDKCVASLLKYEYLGLRLKCKTR